MCIRALSKNSNFSCLYLLGAEGTHLFRALLLICLTFKPQTHATEFFTDYPHSQYPEIAVKKNRPYSCLLIKYMDDLFICIPFRSHIRHPYAYHFKSSARSQRSQSGLDYTKSILIKNNAYTDTTVPALVNQDEYRETMVNLPRIVQEVFSYISDYRDDLNEVRELHPREWQRRYGRSTLPYFESFFRNTRTSE